MSIYFAFNEVDFATNVRDWKKHYVFTNWEGVIGFYRNFDKMLIGGSKLVRFRILLTDDSHLIWDPEQFSAHAKEIDTAQIKELTVFFEGGPNHSVVFARWPA